ncbi:hypothetical protein [Blastopirellula marina]|uniref:Uncharacterized protein n=1 Tax=Blastopirellula marina DSM 3645 TaxID=314230 RepID=A3ZS91_9BACT|nr:hypothetical protein [Blastopirellula marina]EAQ80549.1 hypothetical protein DSM3645_14425 [Blastopirellula marina DSM 3645]
MSTSQTINHPTYYLEDYGQYMSFDSDATIFEEWLWTERLTTIAKSDGTVAAVKLRESLLSPSPRRANRGLIELIEYLAHEHNLTVQRRLMTRPRNRLPMPAQVASFVSWPPSSHVHELVHDHDSGLIYLGRRVGREQIIAELTRAFPSSTFAIMVATNQQADKVQAKLKGWGIDAQKVNERRGASGAGRCSIGLFRALQAREVEFEKRDVIIAYDALETISENGQMLLTIPDVCGRLFGLLDHDANRMQRQSDLLASTFGFRQAIVPMHGRRPVDVRTAFIRKRFSDTAAQTAYQAKRNGIWYNNDRNQMLTSLACGLAEGNGEKVSRYLNATNIGLCCNAQHRVALLTDSIEHLAQLATTIESWPIRVSASVDLTGLPAEKQRLMVRGTQRWVDGQTLLATPGGLANIQPGTFDAILWAGGGPGLPPIPSSQLTTARHSPRSLYVIDVKDRHHSQLRRWSHARQKACLDAGWIDGAECPVQAAFQAFLERRNQEVFV